MQEFGRKEVEQSLLRKFIRSRRPAGISLADGVKKAIAAQHACTELGPRPQRTLRSVVDAALKQWLQRSQQQIQSHAKAGNACAEAGMPVVMLADVNHGAAAIGSGLAEHARQIFLLFRRFVVRYDRLVVDIFFQADFFHKF